MAAPADAFAGWVGGRRRQGARAAAAAAATCLFPQPSYVSVPDLASCASSQLLLHPVAPQVQLPRLPWLDPDRPSPLTPTGPATKAGLKGREGLYAQPVGPWGHHRNLLPCPLASPPSSLPHAFPGAPVFRLTLPAPVSSLPLQAGGGAVCRHFLELLPLLEGQPAVTCRSPRPLSLAPAWLLVAAPDPPPPTFIPAR